MCETLMKLCYRCLKNGQKIIESNPDSGRLSLSRTSENIDLVWAAILVTDSARIRRLSGDSKNYCFRDFDIKLESAKLVLRRLLSWETITNISLNTIHHNQRLIIYVYVWNKSQVWFSMSKESATKLEQHQRYVHSFIIIIFFMKVISIQKKKKDF